MRNEIFMPLNNDHAHGPSSSRKTSPAQTYRLRPVMRQGTASSVGETWLRYASIDAARADAKQMYRDDRVLRVMVVADSLGTFVEWIDR